MFERLKSLFSRKEKIKEKPIDTIQSYASHISESAKKPNLGLLPNSKPTKTVSVPPVQNKMHGGVKRGEMATFSGRSSSYQDDSSILLQQMIITEALMDSTLSDTKPSDSYSSSSDFSGGGGNFGGGGSSNDYSGSSSDYGSSSCDSGSSSSDCGGW